MIQLALFMIALNLPVLFNPATVLEQSVIPIPPFELPQHTSNPFFSALLEFLVPYSNSSIVHQQLAWLAHYSRAKRLSDSLYVLASLLFSLIAYSWTPLRATSRLLFPNSRVVNLLAHETRQLRRYGDNLFGLGLALYAIIIVVARFCEWRGVDIMKVVPSGLEVMASVWALAVEETTTLVGNSVTAFKALSNQLLIDIQPFVGPHIARSRLLLHQPQETVAIVMSYFEYIVDCFSPGSRPDQLKYVHDIAHHTASQITLQILSILALACGWVSVIGAFLPSRPAVPRPVGAFAAFIKSHIDSNAHKIAQASGIARQYTVHQARIVEAKILPSQWIERVFAIGIMTTALLYVARIALPACFRHEGKTAQIGNADSSKDVDADEEEEVVLLVLGAPVLPLGTPSLDQMSDSPAPTGPSGKVEEHSD